MSDNFVTLSEAAAIHIKENMAGKASPVSGLRLGVTNGGCSGYEYNLAFVAGPGEGDLEVSSQGVAIYVQADAVDLLRGLKLDWVDGLHGAGLKFLNPGATATCGCGTSFSVS
ncbi:MAG: iron-sulfur cluster assembly accessory protein [Proteobacteria bacterium]|nr:iron-sulfur cluster assembly accessory protein [Pseudomonadota bacterium]